MAITGIICEYNPLHLGHRKQLDLVRSDDPEGKIVCIMSGNFVQRGKPAIFDKLRRAEAAVKCGADLVLELPVTASLSSAENFAAEGVRLLSGFCDRLSFGSETGDAASLLSAAQILLSEEFSEKLKAELEKGLSFPAARQAAMEQLGADAELLSRPNDILGVEYCKAILSQNCKMKPAPIRREGNYHDLAADPENPSATAVRALMTAGKYWHSYIPEKATRIFEDAPIHALEAGERAILARLRTMTDEEFESLPFGSEGLWRKLMHECREKATLEEILTAVKSKRYTRSRLDRMVMCAFLGLTESDLATPAPYARVLALNDKGREILKSARETGLYPNIGEKVEHPYQEIENRCGSLYGLFCADAPERPDAESNHRLYYQK